MENCIGIDFSAPHQYAAQYRDGQLILLPNESNPKLPWYVTKLKFNIDPNSHQKNASFDFQNYRDEIDFVEASAPPDARAASDWALATLTHLKNQACVFFHEEITSAVLTVPAFWSERRRAALRKLAETAGFRPIRLLEQSRALLLSDSICLNTANCLVFNIDAGVTSVFLHQISPEMKPLAFEYDANLSEDFLDSLLANFVYNVLDAPGPYHTSIPGILKFRTELARLRSKLRSQDFEYFDIYNESGSIIEKLPFSKHTLEKIIIDHIEKSFPLIPKVLKGAALPLDAVDTIILQGGYANLSFVADRFANTFGKPVLHADEYAIVNGAARFGFQNFGSLRDPQKGVIQNQSQEGIRNPSSVPCDKPLAAPENDGVLYKMIEEVELKIRQDEFEEAVIGLEDTMNEVPIYIAHVCWLWVNKLLKKQEWENAFAVLEKGLYYHRSDGMLKRSLFHLVSTRVGYLAGAGRLLDAKLWLERGMKLDPACQEYRESLKKISNSLRQNGVSIAGYSNRKAHRKKRK